jgi:hypothetical protein
MKLVYEVCSGISNFKTIVRSLVVTGPLFLVLASVWLGSDMEASYLPWQLHSPRGFLASLVRRRHSVAVLYGCLARHGSWPATTGLGWFGWLVTFLSLSTVILL